MRFFAIPNLTASAVQETVPWQEDIKVPDKIKKTGKGAFTQWLQSPTTKHCLFSTVEGMTPGLRVNTSENPPSFMHGLVADYDTPVSDALWDSLPERCSCEFMPIAGSSTFSNGARLVWEFEDPIPLPGWKTLKAFLKIAAKKMGMSKLLPGFDPVFYEHPDQYYEVGRDWRMISTDKIPNSLLWLWMTQAGDAVTDTVSGPVIPVNEVAKEVARKFPGRWAGPFDLGCRGVRFWDESADNPSAAIVRERGMQCFTGLRGFVTWTEIFGPRWVEKYEQDSLGNVVEKWWYDGNCYWARDDDASQWVRVSKEDFRLVAKVKYGMSGTAGKKQTASEVDQLQYQVQSVKRVDAAVPRVLFPDGLLIEGGKRYLNTSTVKCLAPAVKPVEWGENFPWLSKFLGSLFVEEHQKLAFFAWLKWFYESGIARRPRSGQAMFIAGGKGVGKTFLSTCIVSRILGGHQDGRSFFLGDAKQFSDYVFEVPLLTMDDAEPIADTKTQTRFTNAVKRLVANPYQHYEKKFQTACQTVWLGRIMITCNTDPDSLRILPSLEVSNKDKVMLLRAVDESKVEFPQMYELLRLVDQELPYFCRWLLDWEIPDILLGTSRFGVKAVHDTMLEEAARHAETSYAFSELLDEFRMRFWRCTSEKFWEGNATCLLSSLVSTPDLEMVARPFADTRTITRYLIKLVGNPGTPISIVPRTGQKVWRIDCTPESWTSGMRGESESSGVVTVDV